MSNALSVLGNKANLPAHLRQKPSGENAWDEVGGQSLPRIALVDGRIKALLGGTELSSSKKPISVVLVKPGPVGRTYYDKVYEEGVKERPVCYSQDGVYPADDAVSPQCDRCDRCPQNVVGSSKAKKDSRACRFYQPIAVWTPGDKTSDTLFRMVLPATSIFPEEESEDGHRGLHRYVKELRAAGASPDMVFTEVGIMTGKTSVLGFKALGWITDPEDYAKVVELRDSGQCEKLLNILPDMADASAEKEPTQATPRTPRPRRVECDAWPKNLPSVPKSAEEKDTYWFEPLSGAYFVVPAGDDLPDWDKCREILTYDDFAAEVIKAQQEREAAAAEMEDLQRKAEARRKAAAAAEAQRKAEEEAAAAEAQRKAEEAAAAEAQRKAEEAAAAEALKKPAARTRVKPATTETPDADKAAQPIGRRRQPAAMGTTPPTRNVVATSPVDPEAPRKQVSATSDEVLVNAILADEND